MTLHYLFDGMVMRYFICFLVLASSVFSQEELDLIDAQKFIYSHEKRCLHLGCGETKFEGYINIDFPLDDHTIQTKSGADFFFDITRLKLRPESIDEVRNHHLFEHFSRFDALALLCAWHTWLKEGGTLVIETPDFQKSIENLALSKDLTYQQKQLIIRHIFGSHEAHWAYHLDGWYKEKFKCVLKELGFGEFEFKQSEWKHLSNIIVRCKKIHTLSTEDLIKKCKKILSRSLVNTSVSEMKMLDVWIEGLVSSLSHKIDF